MAETELLELGQHLQHHSTGSSALFILYLTFQYFLSCHALSVILSLLYLLVRGRFLPRLLLGPTLQSGFHFTRYVKITLEECGLCSLIISPFFIACLPCSLLPSFPLILHFSPFSLFPFLSSFLTVYLLTAYYKLGVNYLCLGWALGLLNLKITANSVRLLTPRKGGKFMHVLNKCTQDN
uniref:Uncharacterized protein n=1 Tax=Rousettus aegyptiacus TaxID=9407 RepID=A0A7J8DXL3_ROUAE|nr:hypothetical protein HJG63_008344 [Rousettus aegyptiacus]